MFTAVPSVDGWSKSERRLAALSSPSHRRAGTIRCTGTPAGSPQEGAPRPLHDPLCSSEARPPADPQRLADGHDGRLRRAAERLVLGRARWVVQDDPLHGHSRLNGVQHQTRSEVVPLQVGQWHPGSGVTDTSCPSPVHQSRGVRPEAECDQFIRAGSGSGSGRRRGKAVVDAAQQGGVRQTGRAALVPGDDVVHVAPAWWPEAPGVQAVPVAVLDAHLNGPVNRRFDRPTARSSLSPPRTAGRMSASQASRRAAAGERSAPVSSSPAWPSSSRSHR